MIVYSIIPEERIFEGFDQLQAPEEVVYQGMILQVERLEQGKARIVRLICPDPNRYLDPRFAPGQIVELAH